MIKAESEIQPDGSASGCNINISGSSKHIMTEALCIIGDVYRILKPHIPESAEEFRKMIQIIGNDPNHPIWNQKKSTDTIVFVPGKERPKSAEN